MYPRTLLLLAALLVTLFLSTGGLPSASPGVDADRSGDSGGPEWELRRFAGCDERPEARNGAVQIDADHSDPPFPRYFNQLGVKTIRIGFRGPAGTTRKVSIVWSGGSQGLDRFGVSVDGIPAGLSRLEDSARRPHTWFCDDFLLRLGNSEEHVLEIRSLPEHGSEIEFCGIRMAALDAPDYRPLCYRSVGSLERYEEALGERGVMVESVHLTIFAPRKDAAKARKLSAFLEEAYAAMAGIYGRSTTFRFAVEHFPPGHERGWGGISGAGTIGYTTEALDRFARMGRRDVRGFAGYTEEMSHGFKDVYRCGGTYEALGVAVQEDVVRRLVPKRTADAFWGWRHEQCAETAAAYVKAGFANPDPDRYPWNVLFTRILNHLFLELRQEYGPEMWPHFFQVIRQMDYPLHGASKTERMKTYVEIFSTLFGRDLRPEFEKYGVDLAADPPWGWETYKK